MSAKAILKEAAGLALGSLIAGYLIRDTGETTGFVQRAPGPGLDDVVEIGSLMLGRRLVAKVWK